MGYVDIHTHVVHGLDAAPKTVQEGAAMLLRLPLPATDIVATPHANSRYRFNPALSRGADRSDQRPKPGAPSLRLRFPAPG